MKLRGSTALLMGSAISALILFTFSHAFHPKEEPAADLVGASDLIVLADVSFVTGAPDRHRPHGGISHGSIPLVARLSVRRVWKGTETGPLDVPFDECLSWPAPPRYQEGDRVVAFLRRLGGSWATIEVVPVAGDPDRIDQVVLGADESRAAAPVACLPGLSTMAPFGAAGGAPDQW